MATFFIVHHFHGDEIKKKKLRSGGGAAAWLAFLFEESCKRILIFNRANITALLKKRRNNILKILAKWGSADFFSRKAAFDNISINADDMNKLERDRNI